MTAIKRKLITSGCTVCIALAVVFSGVSGLPSSKAESSSSEAFLSTIPYHCDRLLMDYPRVH